MKRFLFTVCMGLAVVSPAPAQQDSTGGKVMDALLQVGGQLLENQAQRLEADETKSTATRKIGGAVLGGAAKLAENQRQKRAEKAGDQMPPPPAAPTRGQAVLQGAVDGLLADRNTGLGDMMAHAAKGAVDTLMEEYKQQYKQEGREYAKELGNIITERMLQNKRIDDTITSVQALCWGVVIYLSFVTLLIFFWLWRMSSLHREMRDAIDDLRKRGGVKD